MGKCTKEIRRDRERIMREVEQIMAPLVYTHPHLAGVFHEIAMAVSGHPSRESTGTLYVKSDDNEVPF